MNSLHQWFWDGNRWQAEASLRLPFASQDENRMEFLDAAVNKDGKMVVVLAIPTGAGEIAERSLFYSMRTLDLLSGQTANQETPIQPAPSPTYTPASTPPEGSLKPIATVSSNSTQLQGPIERINTSDTLSSLTRALFPVALLLLSVMGIVVLNVARVKNR
jgi:hypothetical protein